MHKRYVLTLFCATALSAPTANAYTAIALGTAAKEGPNYEVCGYSHSGNRVYQTVIERRALANCILAGGTNPKIVLSTGKPGYFAVAGSKKKSVGSSVGQVLCQALRPQRRRQSQTARSAAGKLPLFGWSGRMECLAKNSKHMCTQVGTWRHPTEV
jgi:hypothetical protein